MEFQTLRYQELTVPELLTLNAQVTEQIWNAMDLIHALKIGQAAVRNALNEKIYGSEV